MILQSVIFADDICKKMNYSSEETVRWKAGRYLLLQAGA